jgi:hypothetical protein
MMKNSTTKSFFLSLMLLSFSLPTLGSANDCGNVNLNCQPKGGQKLINSSIPGEKCEKNDPFRRICGVPPKWTNRQARSNKCAEMHPKECGNNNCLWSEATCDKPW